MPGVSRDQAILGNDSAPAVTPAEGEPQKPEAPPAPGSMLDRIQRDVDGVETVPVPTQEPIDTSSQ